MAKLADENNRFKEMFNKMSEKNKKKIAGLEIDNNREEFNKDIQRVSNNIDSKKKSFLRANVKLRSRYGRDIEFLIKSYHEGKIWLVDKKLLTAESWDFLNDILWEKYKLQFVSDGEKMRLTQVGGATRIKKEEEKYKRHYPDYDSENLTEFFHHFMEKDKFFHEIERKMLKDSIENIK